MPGWIRPLILTAALLAVAAPAGGALAQTAPAPAAPKTINGSPMAQVPFAEHPFPLSDDGTYREFLSKVAADVRRRCGRLESFGWEFPKGDQAKLDRIFESTMDSFKAAGWAAKAVEARSVQNPDMLVFLADKEKRQLLMVWLPMPDAAMLIMCETDGSGSAR